MKRVKFCDLVTLLEEIKKGNFKLKKAEDKKDDKVLKTKEEDKSFVELV